MQYNHKNYLKVLSNLLVVTFSCNRFSFEWKVEINHQRESSLLHLWSFYALMLSTAVPSDTLVCLPLCPIAVSITSQEDLHKFGTNIRGHYVPTMHIFTHNLLMSVLISLKYMLCCFFIILVEYCRFVCNMWRF